MKIRQVTKQIEMENEDGVEDLARNIEYLENQSRRNNVKIFGIPEDDEEKSWNDTESKVKEAIKDKLGIKDEIKIEHVHRIGKRSTDDGKQRNSWHGSRSNGPRPIVAKIDSWKVKERIVKKAREVKPDGLKIYSDFSQRALDRRRSQIPALPLLCRQQEIKGKMPYLWLIVLLLATKEMNGMATVVVNGIPLPTKSLVMLLILLLKTKFSLTQFPVTRAEGSNCYHYECEP